MIVEELPVAGVLLVREQRHPDQRGAFTRVVDLPALSAASRRFEVVQVSYAENSSAGTIRGLHYQVSPHQESKIVWCVGGSAFDVLVDVRPDSPTFGKWVGVRLSAAEPCSVLVPPGVAHGYQCLEDDTTMAYLIDAPFHPESARTLRWDDVQVAIPWPLPLGPISSRDAEAPSWPPES
jgi:dTDP-4-dehydrorhamnose 3,5-epimerase